MKEVKDFLLIIIQILTSIVLLQLIAYGIVQFETTKTMLKFSNLHLETIMELKEL